MNTNLIKKTVEKEFEFASFSKETINEINADFDEMVTSQPLKSANFLMDILRNFYYIKVKEMINNGNFDIVVKYLQSKNAERKSIFSELNTILKKSGAEFSFDLGVYLLSNYSPFLGFFEGVIKYLKTSKDAELKDVINDEYADLLFDVYCDKYGIQLNNDDIDTQIYKEGFYSDDPVKMYLYEISRYSLLTPEEESELFTKYKEENSNYAREKLVNSNLRLVVNIAKQYYNRLPQNKIPILDLIQEGNIGLMKAIDRFDNNKGYKLSTYATWWIRQNVSRYVLENNTSIRIPVHSAERVRKINRAAEIFAANNNREATIDELSDLTGFSKEYIRECQKISRNLGTAASLDEPIGEEADSTLKDFIPSTENIQENVELLLLKDDVAKVLKTLTPKEAEIITERFGLADGIPRTLEEVGKAKGISRERVRQIELKALRKLRMPSRANLLRGETKTIHEEQVKRQKNEKYMSFISELKRAPKSTIEYVLNGLNDEEKKMLFKKVGDNYNQNNYIGIYETSFANILIPKMEQRYVRITYGTETYKSLFEKYDKRIPIDNYYLLSENEQDLLKRAYGNDLNAPINSDITLEEEKRIAKIIVSKMLCLNLGRTMRQYNNFELVMESPEFVLPDYLVKLFTYLYPEKNISTLQDRKNVKRSTVDGIEYLLTAVLKKDQFEYIKNIFQTIDLYSIKREYSSLPRFSEGINKLKNSPHILSLSNRLVQMAEKKKTAIGDLDFYSFFTKDEIKKLPQAMHNIDFEDYSIIHRVFTSGINVLVYRKNVSNQDYYDLTNSIKNVKTNIKNISGVDNSNYLGPLYEIYRYCEHLYGRPEFVYLVQSLSKLEVKTLADSLSVPTDFNTTVTYISNKRGMSEDKVISILKHALRKIYVYLQDESNKNQFEKEEVNLVLKLIKDQTN